MHTPSAPEQDDGDRLLATVLGLAGAGYLSKVCARFTTVAKTGTFDETQPGGGLTNDQALARDTLRELHPQSTEASDDLKGNNDLLVFTQPDTIRDIHRRYFLAGADIVETNTFSGTTIAQADYDMEDIVYELNKVASELAVEAAKEVTALEPHKPRLVAGAIGPTNRTLSISPSVEDLGARNCDWDGVIALSVSKMVSTMRMWQPPSIRRKELKIRELVESGEVKVEYVESLKNFADFFTKPLPRKEFESFRKEIMNDTA